jgi:glycosyltransferase involved in cell wall biosynthesis
MSVKKTEISIIMNCYNSAVYLAEAVQSVMDQTFTDWEIIFWDNQSTDDSAKIMKSFKDKRIHYFYAPKHTNLGEARNLAIEKTRAKWIAFLDCDDLWLPEKLEEQFKIIKEEEKKKTNLGLVYCKITIFGDNYKEKEPRWSKRWVNMPEGDIFYEYLLKTNFIPLLSAVIYKDLFLKTGGIPLQYRQGEDYFMFAAISEISKVRVVNKILCRYRIHSGNLTNRQMILSVNENIDILNHWKNKFRNNPVLNRKWKKKIKAIQSEKFAYLVLFEKDFYQAFKLLISENIYWEVLRYIVSGRDF